MRGSMKNSVSDRSICVESEEEDDEVHDEEEGSRRRAGDDDSDGSDDSSEAGSPRGSRPSSYATAWPQSYR